ncbi:MAG: Crp/Fnr family transcriptional regulator [Methylobacterium sp.]|nr:Crp/Fnr family transcriptional regulator [Methylobacterium sp.]
MRGVRARPWDRRSDPIPRHAPVVSRAARPIDASQTDPDLPFSPPAPRIDMSNPFVRKLEGFGPLPDADRALLERIGANAHLIGQRVDLIREGDTPDGVILIMEGIACRQKHRANGARQITAYLVPGDACDLDVALLTQMDHTITTLSACRVVRLPLDFVKRLTDEHPAIARALRLSSLVDEATLREWLVNVGCRSAIERIAHLFCELLVRLQIVGFANADSYEFPITQLDLADTVGLSNVHVNRSLQELRREGVIELKGRTLKILNLQRLKSIAEFDAKYLHLGARAAA